MTRYALIAALLAALALGAALAREVGLRKDAEAVSAALTRSLADYKKRHEQAQLAREVESAARRRAESIAADANQTILKIREGGYDEALPDDLRDLLNRGVR